MEPEQHTEVFSNKNNTAVPTDEANILMNGTHFGRIDATNPYPANVENRVSF
jgi:hypothetical protein